MEVIELKIENTAGLGDGVAQHDGRRIFVPYTLPGDMVRAEIVRKTRDADFTRLIEVIAPGKGRVKPVCKHFAVCGGCALQHMEEEAYTAFKQQMAREAVRKAGFDPECVAPLIRFPAASRRRVDLKVAGGKLGYYAEQSHRLVDIEECKVLEPQLEALILRLKPGLSAVPGLAGVQINGVDDGYDITLTGSVAWGQAGEKEIRRVSVREGTVLRTLYQSGPVTVTLAGVKVEVPPGAFLQASREAQAIMTRQVLAGVGKAERVLDLFAGIGTYSFALSTHAKVTAIEGENEMVDAMRRAAVAHKLAGFRAESRDLFRNPVERFDGYDAVVINPPRAGASEQVARLARSKVASVVMVSCNPATFARDARILREGGYRLEKIVPIDQFVFSPHLELVAEFAAR